MSEETVAVPKKTVLELLELLKEIRELARGEKVEG